MHAARRQTPRLIQRSRQSSVRSAPRRLAHDDHGAAHDVHGSSNEGFGRSFYLAVALIPTVPIVYYASRNSSASNPLTALIDKYTEYTTKAQERNILHTKAVEQAAADRQLFQHARTGGRGTREMEMPELFMSGFTDMNVAAGHAHANIDHVIALYRDRQFKEEEVKRRLQAQGEDLSKWREVLEKEEEGK